VNKTRLLERFFRYVTCDSESGSEGRFCAMIEDELVKLGMEVWRDEIGHLCNSDGYNIHAFLPGVGEPILFSAHLDTAVPGIGIVPIIDGDIIRSSGDTILGADDKSGIAAVMEALESYIEDEKRPHRPVEVFFSICEEMGLLGAEHADYSKIKSRQALVLDGSERGCIMNQTAGILRLHVKLFGKSSHAALAPQNGINAVKAASWIIQNIQCGYLDGGDSDINIANLLAPGEANMVPDRASFDVEIRGFATEIIDSRKGHVEDVISWCSKLIPGITYTVETTMRAPVLHVPPESPLLKRLCSVCSSLDISPKLLRSFAGCDAIHLDAHGIETVDFGTGMADVHSVNESILIEDLVRTTLVVEGMMEPL
jgi:tripeptide aminopeptidase